MTTLLHNSVADVTYILHVYSINYWISTIAKIPSTEQDGVFNVMFMGKNGWLQKIDIKDEELWKIELTT
jgi:hypothetical protein